MKYAQLVIAAVMLSGILSAQPVIAPGTQRTDLLFNRADAVCSCKVVATQIASEEPEQPLSSNNVLRHMLATAEVQEGFKPTNLQPGETLVIRFLQQFPGVTRGDLQVLHGGEIALLFLKRVPDGSYEFADSSFGATVFQVLPKASTGTGLTRLESVLLNVLDQAPPGGPHHDDLHALWLLEGFPSLTRGGTAHMARLANSSDPNIALAAIGTLIKSSSPKTVELLRNYLDNYHSDQEPTSVWSIGAWLRQIDDPEALPALESLSSSRFASVQLGAMDALRKIKSPSSAPVLVQRLYDPNRVVRYQAVITLAETFGKKQEFAPSMQLFEQDPERYVTLWKDWWSHQPEVAPRPKKRPPDILRH
jgi:hypothetical protein